MKMNFVSKVGGILIVAASLAASAVMAGEVVIKKGGLVYKGPAKSLFATPQKTAPIVTCVMCKPEFKPTLTQDSKLRTKTVMVEAHACKGCMTTIKSVGYQKAARKDIVEHRCAGRVASVATCCSSMPGMN
jgi:hypothetical protein